MSKHITDFIRSKGQPITVAELMGEVLADTNNGSFYMNRKQFGKRGDFHTTLYIDRMLGEMLGVWSVDLWEKLGKPMRLSLVELQPGRGLVMSYLIRTTAHNRRFSESLSVHFVERCPKLRAEQAHVLLPHFAGSSAPQYRYALTSWHKELQEVPRGVPCVIIAHELYNSLPIHQFQMDTTAGRWCEKLVTIGDSDGHFRFVLSPELLPSSKDCLEQRLLWAGREIGQRLEHIEVCPPAWTLTKDIARRIAEDGGGALVIDYGEDAVIASSLRAIRNERFVGLLGDPGSADLRASVDFAAIKRAVQDVDGTTVYGPVKQREFFGRLGFWELFEKLEEDPYVKEDPSDMQKWKLTLLGYLLCDYASESNSEGKPNGMGWRYKVLSIVQTGLGEPLGFHDVEEESDS